MPSAGRRRAREAGEGEELPDPACARRSCEGGHRNLQWCELRSLHRRTAAARIDTPRAAVPGSAAPLRSPRAPPLARTPRPPPPGARRGAAGRRRWRAAGGSRPVRPRLPVPPPARGPPGALGHADGHRTVEADHGRRHEPLQFAVQPGDVGPVGLRGRGSGGVAGGDGNLALVRPGAPAPQSVLQQAGALLGLPRSHAVRSWSSRLTGSPAASTRVARRASCSGRRASRPSTSGSSGMSRVRTRAGRMASAHRFARTRSAVQSYAAVAEPLGPGLDGGMPEASAVSSPQTSSMYFMGPPGDLPALHRRTRGRGIDMPFARVARKERPGRGPGLSGAASARRTRAAPPPPPSNARCSCGPAAA